MSEGDLNQEAYFYAGGERVLLDPAKDFYAVDLNRLGAGTKLRHTVEGLLNSIGASMRRGVAVVPRSDIPPDVANDLSSHGAFQPVYEDQTSLLVVLPEVRIEEARPGVQKKIHNWLIEQKRGINVRTRQERTEVQPKSGSGGDALRLANEIQEQLAPELVQARMLRIRIKPKIY